MQVLRRLALVQVGVQLYGQASGVEWGRHLSDLSQHQSEVVGLQCLREARWQDGSL